MIAHEGQFTGHEEHYTLGCKNQFWSFSCPLMLGKSRTKSRGILSDDDMIII